MKQFRMLVIGLIAGVMLTISATAFAAGGISKIEAYLCEGFTFKVNGQVATLENTPIVYNDTSYMPVRELAGILGYDVGFEDNTITLDVKQSQATPAATEQVKDVDDVTTVITPPEIIEVDLNEWMPLRELAAIDGFIVKVSPDNELVISYNDLSIIFPVPTKNGTYVVEGGFTIMSLDNKTYFSRSSYNTIVGQ